MNGPLEQLAELVRRVSGIRTRSTQMTSFGAAARRALGAEQADLHAAAGDVQALDRLVDEVAVKETFFMRDRLQLEQIDWHRLFENARAAGAPGVTVWTAACATGEEAYTLALLAIEAFGSDRPPVSIRGTDLSQTALERAARGRYREWALRGMRPDEVERHLEHDGDEFVVRPALRRLVDFERHNLVGDAPPAGGPFDLIVCRNVLIYFDPAGVERALAMVGGALRPGGTLVLGAADRLCRPRRVRGSTPRPPASERPLAAPAGRRRAAPATPVNSGPPGDLNAALRAADAGALTEAIETAGALAAREPMNAGAHFVLGVARLAAGESAEAVRSLRRALYADPTFAVAAFKLGRAHDALQDRGGARRAYEQALRLLDTDDDRHARLIDQIDLGDVAAACRTRLADLRSGGAVRH